MAGSSTREQIVAAADKLFYQQGFEHTSFSDIADKVQISRGNFYYHFSTKDDILSEVIARRIANTQKLLKQWEDQTEDPKQRIRCFIHILIMNWSKIKRFGCPVGTLSTELSKLGHIAQNDANALFSLFRSWLCQQFTQLGAVSSADDLAMHVLARSQGVATLANAFQDETFVKREVEQMCEWLDAQINVLSEV